MPIREDLWEFPHTMQLKVLGETQAPLREALEDILAEHVNGFDPLLHLSCKPSAKGNFLSFTAQITVDDKEQVERLYAALNACPHVKMSL